MVRKKTIRVYVCDLCGKEESGVKMRFPFTRDWVLHNGFWGHIPEHDFRAPDGWKKGRTSRNMDICPMCAMKYPDACRET